MDFSLTDEQKLLQQTVHEFAENEMRPMALELDEKDEFSWNIVKKAAKLGLTCLGVPEEYGGPGSSIMDNVIACEELAWGCLGMTGGILLNGVGILPILVAGSEEQKREYLPRLTDPEEPRLASFALSEPGAGSDVASMSTTAVKKGDRYLINGTKCFITNGGLADFYCTFAVTDKEKGYGGITAFVMDGDTPGFSMGKKERKMGLRASQTAELIFDDAEVPEENVLGGEGQGFYIAMQSLDASRPGVGAAAVGVAQAAYEEALAYSKERVQFGRPICRNQVIAFMLADMATEIEAARLICYKAAWLIDNQMPSSKLSSMSKYYASDVAMKVATDAVQIHGGYGYMKEYLVEKLFRDAKILQIVEGTNQIQRMVLSGELISD